MSSQTEYRYNRLTWPEMNAAIAAQKRCGSERAMAATSSRSAAPSASRNCCSREARFCSGVGVQANEVLSTRLKAASR